MIRGPANQTPAHIGIIETHRTRPSLWTLAFTDILDSL